jgi:hypothetical protein
MTYETDIDVHAFEDVLILIEISQIGNDQGVKW